jgi:hypothetical protein
MVQVKSEWTFWTVWRIQLTDKDFEKVKRRPAVRVERNRRWGQGKMKTKDKSRKWMWMFLAALVSLQMYFVWELLAVFALFALGFAALASVVGSLYMLHRFWALTVDRLADSQHPIMVATRQGIYTIEDAARRPFRRPGSAAAR